MDAEFARLLETYGAALKRLCSVYQRNSADQEDLFQQIAVALWKALPGFRGEASERTWLYRIAHNVALTDGFRTDRRRKREVPADDDARVRSYLADPRREELLDAVRRLGAGDRELILMLEGFTAAESAAVLGITEGNTAVRLTRIRQRLAEMLLVRKGREL